MNPPEPFSVAILAGGRARRFGSDKNRAPIKGKPMIQHVYESVQKMSDDIFVVTKPNLADHYEFLNLRIFCEPEAVYAPLFGLIQALKQAKHMWTLILASDMPAIQPDIFSFLAGVRTNLTRAVIPKTDHIQPLAGFYSKDCITDLELRSKKGDFKLNNLISLDGFKIIKIMPQFYDSFANINTTEEYQLFVQEAESCR